MKYMHTHTFHCYHTAASLHTYNLLCVMSSLWIQWWISSVLVWSVTSLPHCKHYMSYTTSWGSIYVVALLAVVPANMDYWHLWLPLWRTLHVSIFHTNQCKTPIVLPLLYYCTPKGRWIIGPLMSKVWLHHNEHSYDILYFKNSPKFACQHEGFSQRESHTANVHTSL